MSHVEQNEIKMNKYRTAVHTQYYNNMDGNINKLFNCSILHRNKTMRHALRHLFSWFKNIVHVHYMFNVYVLYKRDIGTFIDLLLFIVKLSYTHTVQGV